MTTRTAFIVPAFIVLALSGCASPLLKADTASVTSVVGDIYTDQTLESLSRFIDDPNSIPSLVDLKDGVVEVTAQFNPSVTIPFGNQVATTVVGTASETITAPSRAFTFGGSIGRKVNWGISPVVDAGRLGDAADLFLYAIGDEAEDKAKPCWNWVRLERTKSETDHFLGKYGSHKLFMTDSSFKNRCLAKLILALMPEHASTTQKPGV